MESVALPGQQVRDVDREPVDHPQPTVPQHGDGITGQVSLPQFRLLDVAAGSRRHHHPAPGFRDVLLVQRLTETQQHVENADLTAPCGWLDDSPTTGVPLMPRLMVPPMMPGGIALVLGVRLTNDAAKHITIDHDLELLGGIVRPHRQEIEIALDLHHVVEDQREVFADADIELDDAAGRTVKAKQTVGLIVADGDGGLGADLDPVALVLDLAFVVGVRDRRQNGGGVELLDQLGTTRFLE